MKGCQTQYPSHARNAPFLSLAVITLLICVFPLPALAIEDVLDANGCVKQGVFDRDWRRYSDFDMDGPLTSKHIPVQDYAAAQAEIRKINQEIAVISAHMQLDAEARKQARALEQALRQNMQANLLKAFWRLAWITYNTIGGPTGKTGAIATGRAYSELFTGGASAIAATANALGIIKKLVPKQYSKLPGGEGRVINTGIDVVLDVVKNADKTPLEIAASGVKTLLDTGGKEILDANSTSPDISPAEINILRTQYLDRNKLKEALAASYQLNFERRDRIEALQAQAHAAADKAGAAEQAEKRRVFANINKRCRKAPQLKFALLAPRRVVAGEVADVFVQLPPGREESEFTYGWEHDGDFLMKNSLLARFQSLRLGAHRISVQFFDKEDQHSLGMLTSTIQVVAPATAATQAARSAGQARVSVARLTITPQVVKPGDVVEINVNYRVTGLPKDRKAKAVVRFTVKEFDKTTTGNVANGIYTSWFKLPTPKWLPGRYRVNVAVSVARAADSASGDFVVRQPDVAVVTPPPARPQSVRPDDLVGDWQGTGTVISGGGIEGYVPGRKVPVKVRIVRKGNGYRVYDLLEPDTPTAPMRSRVNGDRVEFYYRGPAIDTEGYAHPDLPLAISWLLGRSGDQISGNFRLVMEGQNVNLYIQAARVR